MLKRKKNKFVLAMLLISVFALPQLCMADIGYGPESIFNNAVTFDISPASLDATRSLIAYRDAGNSYFGTAVIATKSGNSISYGSKSVFFSGSTANIAVTALDATHVLIAFKDALYGFDMAVIATISGNSITYGQPYVFNSASTYETSATALDATHVLIAYYDGGNSGYGTAVIATISDDNEISYSSEFVFNSANTSQITGTALDATHVLIAYEDTGNSSYGTAVIATKSGTGTGATIAYGSEFVFNSAGTYANSATTLDEAHVLISYRDGGNSHFGTGIIATISGNSITYGSPSVFNSAATHETSATTLDETHVMIGYRDYGNSGFGTAVIATISGNTITYGSEFVFNSSDTFIISATALDATHVMITYQDEGNSHRGTGIIATFTSVDVDDIGFDTKFIESKLENYPNPFRSHTKISYAINNRLKSTPVEIRIYNVIGQLVETIRATNGITEWYAGNLPSGIYFYKLIIEDSSEVNKMILIK